MRFTCIGHWSAHIDIYNLRNVGLGGWVILLDIIDVLLLVIHGNNEEYRAAKQTGGGSES